MDKLGIIFGASFGSIGFIISLIFSLFSKNPIFSILSSIVVSTIISIVLGFTVYFILKQKVPEVIEVLSSSLQQQSEFSDFDEDLMQEEALGYEEDREGAVQAQDTNEFMGEDIYDRTSSEAKLQESFGKNEKNKKFGDHILIDKISIKNEPKLMAEAIRTMLSRDES